MWQFAEFRLHRIRAGGFAVLLLAMCCGTSGQELDTAAQLARADSIKRSDPTEFGEILNRLNSDQQQMPAPQRQLFNYLQAWRVAYSGNYVDAIPMLTHVIDESNDVTVRFRAGVTVVNVLAISRRYQEAYAQLGLLLEQLPAVSDKDAREQGLAVAGYLYNQLGQYDLGLSYAEKLIDENIDGKGDGRCRGANLQIEALFKSGKLIEPGREIANAIASCSTQGEPIHTNLIRSYEARLYLSQDRSDAAISLLEGAYNEVQATHYPLLVSEFDSLLARAYRSVGDAGKARQYAIRAVEGAVKNEYTEPTVAAYKLLHDLALEQGDYKAALVYYKKYATADKGYLDDVSARQLAYQMVTHESVANKLQIDALNKQNQVLQLQQALGDKAMENSRLYVALLLSILGFIALWAFKTKRSQLYFMKLARRDGLTGIFNRQHFMASAEAALEYCRKSVRESCLILIDLDHFKVVNDVHGHAAGDTVLRRAVNGCQVHLRSIDIFGRLGGEEFGILLPECALDNARLQAERIREEIASATHAVRGREFVVTASFGVASSSQTGFDLRRMLAEADAALYRAKDGGRNRVVLSEDEPAESPAG